MNVRKQGISFETALLVFADPLVVIEHDRIEGGEYRWRATGLVKTLLVVVAHTIRGADEVEVVRIISARAATPRERRMYEKAD